MVSGLLRSAGATPEEVDRRNANVTSALRQGLNGIALQRMATGKIVAIEAYPRGATIPPSLPSLSDASCGLIAIWTGGRKAP